MSVFWKIMRMSSIVVLAAIVICSFAGIAAAQDAEEDDSTIVIEGRILRPQASYIIQRANVDFGASMKKKSFIYKIEASLDNKPFQ